MSFNFDSIKPPVFHSVWSGNIKLATQLLNNGSSAQTSHMGSFVVHTAARNGQVDMVQMLISFGENVNEQDDDLDTLLHLPAQLTDTSLVQLILDNEVDPNTENVNGQTPLSAATFLTLQRGTRSFERRGTGIRTEFVSALQRQSQHKVIQSKHTHMGNIIG